MKKMKKTTFFQIKIINKFNVQKSKKMLCEKTSTLVGEFFVKIARLEKKLEVIRQMLCEFDQFEPYSSFQRLDRSRNNFITAEDVFLFLKENQQTSFTEEQISATFLKHYDYDQDGILCYAE